MWRQGFWRGLQFLWWWAGLRHVLYKYDEEWDKYLLALLTTNDFVLVQYHKYVYALGPQEIWCANHPYASFAPWDGTGRMRIRPSLFTLFLAEEKFFKEIGRLPE